VAFFLDNSVALGLVALVLLVPFASAISAAATADVAAAAPSWGLVWGSRSGGGARMGLPSPLIRVPWSCNAARGTLLPPRLADNFLNNIEEMLNDLAFRIVRAKVCPVGRS
jgi:hypothetical protein